MRQNADGLELLSDNDCRYIRYHPGKAKCRCDALSRKEREPPLRMKMLNHPRRIRTEKLEPSRTWNPYVPPMAGVGFTLLSADLRTVIITSPTSRSISIHPVPRKCRTSETIGFVGTTQITQWKWDISRWILSQKLSLGPSQVNHASIKAAKQPLEALYTVRKCPRHGVCFGHEVGEVQLHRPEIVTRMTTERKRILQIVKLTIEAKPYPLVKVRWNSPRRGPDLQWNREDQFKKKYHNPHHFTKNAPSSSACDKP
ncbi:hypothetical protein Tco_1234861 [Tanacetum coccineum]